MLMVGEGLGMMKSTETLGYVYGCKNMKKDAILNSNTQKIPVLDIFVFIFFFNYFKTWKWN